MPPRFLSVDEVTAIHASRIATYGGTLGIRDRAGLESAVAMPQAGIGDTYFHEDVFAMAAAYLYHLVAGHPFVDGNKRAGAAAAEAFLMLNGYEVPLEAGEEFEALVWGISRGEAGKAEAAVFFRLRCVAWS